LKNASSIDYSIVLATTLAIMGYPDTFEGFQIEDQKKWTDFKKKEVSRAEGACS
jgi:hypothetical protein